MIGLAEIRAIDPSNQLDDVLALPDHLRDALWRVESAGLEPAETRGMIVCGMVTGPTSAATFATATTPLATLSGTACGQRGGDAGHLGERPRRVRDGDRHDELVGERDRAAERRERADGDGARCGRQHRTDTLTVTYTPPADTTLPVVTITGPTSARRYSDDDDAADARRDGVGQRRA